MQAGKAGNSTPRRGQEIRETRERFGISAKRLAAKAGVTRDTVAAVETGLVRGKPYSRRPHAATYEVLERALHAIISEIGSASERQQ